METIAVLDYSMGNLRSVSKALEHVANADQTIIVTDDLQTVKDADRIVFPGQGAMRDCMAELHNHHLVDAVIEAAQNKPFLGICMGLQALLESSEENPETQALGLFKGEVKKLPHNVMDEQSGLPLKIPHMGWNQVSTHEHELWHGIESGERFYFVHSYYVAPQDESIITGSCDYGLKFTCAIAKDNVFAVQFHPEKSQHAGLQLMQNFLNWKP